MKKLLSMILPVVAAASGIAAGDSIYFALSDGRTLGVATEKVDSVSFSGDASQMLVSVGGNENAVPMAETDSLYFDAVTDKIEISYGSDGVKVLNPKAFEGVNIAVDGDDVEVTSTTSEELEYVLSGASTDGMFKIYSDKKFKLTLNGLTLTNNDGPAINIQSGKKTTLTLADGTVNTIADGAKYTACGDEDMKATLFSEGQIVVQGNGTLNVSGKKKHGICSDDYILVSSGVVNVTEAASDGIHANDYVRIDGGSVSITASGDGIVLIQDGDTSYCTAVKSDSDFSITDGSLTITSSGSAGKGISVDGNVSIAGGTVSIATTGDGGTYTTADGTTDSYSATGIKADGNIEILAGTVTVTSAGTGGKGISADGTLTIGGDANAPTVNVTTTGKKFYVSGYGEDADYANPKAVKAEGDLTVNSGLITIKCTQDGGEGLESKSMLTINGGTVEVETYDDCINAATNVTINGGNIYCNASGNDGIDSNGTLTINGGLILSSGTKSPEEGFDCDNNTFTVTGGVMVGTGGGSSKPTESVCTQRILMYSASISGKLLRIEDAAGNAVLTYQVPSKYSGNVMLLFSDAALAQGTTYTIYTGGAITGAEEFHGYYTGGTYSGGTKASTFTPTSMITTIGSGGGNRPGGGGGGGGRP